MAGYIGYSKSWNAAQAEKNGRFPASVCAKKTRVPAALIGQFIRPSEWHHTSKWYNETDYFLLKAVEIVFGRTPPDSPSGYQPNPAAIQALKEYRQRARRAEAQVHKDCKVEWLEWSGSRLHPVSKRCVAYDCTVSVKGVTTTVTFADGKTMVKRLATRGFDFSQEKNHDAERQEIELKRQRDAERARKAQERRQKEQARYQAETARREEIIQRIINELLPAAATRDNPVISDTELKAIMSKHMPCLMAMGSAKARRNARKQINNALQRAMAISKSA